MAASKKPAAVRRRRGNRRELLLEAAARRFLYEGYAAASMRDIAADAGMQAGSIYYHFPSKADLLAAVHDEGMRRISDAVLESLEGPSDPWQRLEAAFVAHLEFLLEGNIVVQALMQEMPTGSSPIRTRVTRLRDDYEGIFIRLLEDLKLPRGVDLHSLRLMLLGAMNWSFTWYRPGAETPRRIASKFVKYLRVSLQEA